MLKFGNKILLLTHCGKSRFLGAKIIFIRIKEVEKFVLKMEKLKFFYQIFFLSLNFRNKKIVFTTVCTNLGIEIELTMSMFPW